MTIKHHAKLQSLLFVFTLLFSLTACGGGGGGGETTPTTQLQAQKITAIFALQGSAAIIVGSVDLVVVLPDGFVLETDSSNQPTTSAMTLLVPGATSATNYIPATAGANGAIKAGIIKSDGFAGNVNLVKMTRIYAAGATLPTADDFILTVVASDLNGTTLADISGQINVSSQPAL